MKLFNNFRNTTGTAGNVNVAGATYSRTEVRPHAGKILRGAGLPQAAQLQPRVDNFEVSGLRVDAAREFVAQCKRPVHHHPGSLTARTDGRTQQYLRSAANTFGKAVGIGRGSAPHVEPDWARPDAPTPVKIQVGPSKLHRALFGVTPAQKQADRDATAAVSRKTQGLMAESKVALREATDRETALLNKTAHVDGVLQTLRTALQQAREEHGERVVICEAHQGVHRDAVAELTRTGERVTVLQAERSVLDGQAREISHGMAANRAQRQALDVQLLNLPVAPAGDELAVAVAQQARAHRGLEGAQAGLPPRQQALQAAQQNLDDAKLRLRRARPFSVDRAMIKDQVTACRLVRNEARIALTARENIVNRFQTQVQRYTQAVNTLEERCNGSAQRLRVTEQRAMLEQVGVQLRWRNIAMLRDLAGSDTSLAAAHADHDTAIAAELAARIDMESAERAQEETRVRRDRLERELPKLEPVAQSLVDPTHEAHARASVLRQEQDLRLTQKVNALVTSPPGFDRTQVTPELQEQMRLLTERLDGVQAGLTPKQTQNLQRDRLPTDQSLEIISRSLALATGGQGAEATLALTELMNRQFADLVPHRGMNFNGQPQNEGDVLSDDGDVKRTASLLSDRPGGAELLRRLVQPGPTPPSRQLQDAVAVYFRATNLTSAEITPDVPSLRWLQRAEQAAKILAHPEAGRDDAAAMQGLNRLQRVAFNGVRNGFTSLGDGTPYDKANKAIQKFSDQWVPRARTNANQSSPLHSRHLLTKVAADVGFPTLENNLNIQLKTACDELQKLVANQLVDARSRVALARQEPAADPAEAAVGAATAQALPEVPEHLIRAQNVLHYIRKRADRGERIDTMTLNSKVWKSIDKKTKQHLNQELAAQPTPQGGRLGKFTQQLRTLGGEITQQLRADRSEPGDRIPDPAELGPQPAFQDLGWTLLEMQATKPTVLDALRQLQVHLDPTHPAATASNPDASLSAGELAELDAYLDGLGEDDGVQDASVGELEDELNAIAGGSVHDDPQLQELERRLNALGGPAAGAHEVQDDQDAALDELEEEDFYSAVGSEPDDEFHSIANDSSDDDPGMQDLRRRLNALRGLEAAGQGQDDAFLRQQARPDWVNVPADDGLPPIPGVEAADAAPQVPEPDEAQALLAELDALPVVAAAAAQPPSALERALTEADELKQRIDRFRNSTGDFSPEALEQWMLPAIQGEFGAISANNGKQAGVGTSGLVGTVAQISGVRSLLVRPELDVSVTKNDQFRFGRDYYGIELSLGRNKGGSLGVGASAGLFNTVPNTDGVLASGPGVSVTHTWTGTKTSDGAVLRAPKSADNTHPQLTRELGEMVSTALTWREAMGEDQKQLYLNPLDALLDNHPTISVSAVESAKVVSHSASASLVGFAVPLVPFGGGLSVTAGGVTAGITSSNVQERSSFKLSAGVQGFTTQTKGASHTVGLGAGAATRLRYKVPDYENMAPVRGTLASIAANAAIRKSSALGGANIVRMSDGTIAAERYVEYSHYDKFEAAVRPHREKWIQAGVATGQWPEGFPESDKRIVVERALDDYMATSKASLKSGTVTLNETMSVKPEVCAQLSANLALEELARLDRRNDDALALQVVRENILADDSSYQPLFLKTLGRSSIAENKGLNLLVSAMSSKSANVTRAIDWFPRVAT